MDVSTETLPDLRITGNIAARAANARPGPASLVGLLLWVVLLAGCVSRGLPVAVDYANATMRTRVDAEIARYYLMHYRHGRRLRPQFDIAIDRVAQAPLERLLNRDYLATLAQRYSTDFAAALLIDRLRAQPANRTAETRFRALVTSPDARESVGRYRILFVPGWGYRSWPETGADLAVPRRAAAAAGFDTVLVATAERGTVIGNAHLIAEALRRAAPQPVIVVSVSKSGAEVAYCLGRLLSADASRHVRAWVNVGGVLQGTALVSELGGLEAKELADLSPRAGRERFTGLTFPRHLAVLNYVGIPFSGDVTPRVRHGYRLLRDLGPNDGLALTVDQLVPGAATLVEPGLDHFFQDPALGNKTVAFALLVISWLETERR